MLKIHQFHIFRSLDLLSLVASNAYTACIAGIIAFNNSPVNEAFFHVDVLAKLALGSTLLIELVAVSLWVWHNHQCNKLLKAAGLPTIYRTKKALDDALVDPLQRQQYSAASHNKSMAMSSIALCGLLLMASAFVAMYLSNTGLTKQGWADGKFAYAIYAAPLIGAVIFFFMYVSQHRLSVKDEAEAQKWISLSTRPPKSQDIQPGYVQDMVLCRSPNHVVQWGGNYRVFKISKINGKHMPPPGKREGIEWTLLPL